MTNPRPDTDRRDTNRRTDAPNDGAGLLGTHVAAKTKHNNTSVIAQTAKEAAERAVAEALLKFPVPATEYLNTPQAAAYVNYSEEFLEIARHRADGSGPDYLKMARAVRYKRSDLDRWMESRRVCNEPPPPMKTHRRAGR